jgi:hypothetical protein
MGQAFDEGGRPLGPGVFGETKREVFDELLKRHPDAHEYRIKTLKDKLDEEAAKLREEADATAKQESE